MGLGLHERDPLRLPRQPVTSRLVDRLSPRQLTMKKEMLSDAAAKLHFDATTARRIDILRLEHEL